MFHLSSIHRSAIKPESELTRKYCKMALKYSFKLVFLKCIFEFMLIELHKCQTACMAEKSALSVIILPIYQYSVASWPSCVGTVFSCRRYSCCTGSNLCIHILVFFVHFFVRLDLDFFIIFFPFACFPLFARFLWQCISSMNYLNFTSEDQGSHAVKLHW